MPIIHPDIQFATYPLNCRVYTFSKYNFNGNFGPSKITDPLKTLTNLRGEIKN